MRRRGRGTVDPNIKAGATFPSGESCPVGGHYTDDGGRSHHFKKGVELPRGENDEQVMWQLIQQGSVNQKPSRMTLARITRPEKKKGIMDRIGEGADKFRENTAKVGAAIDEVGATVDKAVSLGIGQKS